MPPIDKTIQPQSTTPDPAKSPELADLTDTDYYLTAEGYVVFTAAYHRRRGYCCRNGCRHCPYGFKKNV